VSWADLFEGAAGFEVSVDEIRETVARGRKQREANGKSGTSPDASGESTDEPRESSPARVVADADVLAADLLVGGPAREALDGVRVHSWVRLVASDPLLDDAEATVADLATERLAADWRERTEADRDRVDHPPDDHPALASAYRGGAMHVLSFDGDLRSAGTGAAIRAHVETSVKHPQAFARLFDPGSLYEAVEGGTYPGPDRDPRV
jgi:hypothetical protein